MKRSQLLGESLNTARVRRGDNLLAQIQYNLHTHLIKQGVNTLVPDAH